MGVCVCGEHMYWKLLYKNRCKPYQLEKPASGGKENKVTRKNEKEYQFIDYHRFINHFVWLQQIQKQHKNTSHDGRIRREVIEKRKKKLFI